MGARRRAIERLTELFRPAVMRAVEKELEGMLRTVTPDRIRVMISIVDRRITSRITKALALRILKAKLRKAEKGKPVSLSKREERILFEKASKHLPPVVVEAWLGAMSRYGIIAGSFSLDWLGDDLLPDDMDDASIRLDDDAALVGIDAGHVRAILREVATRERQAAIDALTLWLDAEGVTVYG